MVTSMTSPSPKQILQRVLSWTLRRAMGSYLHSYGFDYKVSADTRLALMHYEIKRKELIEQLRKELKNI